jgi:hypothetical protein
MRQTLIQAMVMLNNFSNPNVHPTHPLQVWVIQIRRRRDALRHSTARALDSL